MKFVSTRANAPATDLAAALKAGLAPDGGLYVPERVPRIKPGPVAALPELAATWLAPYFAGSPLAGSLGAICRRALDLPLPLVALEDRQAWLLELFHGPTAAFKDFAARFLAACLAALRRPEDSPLTVLVATSGDTGGAVAAAFHGIEGFQVLVLYPDGRVSARQAHQLGAFGGNVRTLRVQGSFDDCQRLVKRALADPELADPELADPELTTAGLTSANSISIGRLLPQVGYYAWAAARLAQLTRADRPLAVIVPTGNLGNALACVLARDMGAPIGEVVLATNANRTLSDYFEHGRYRGRPGLETLANAMDVGDPSNFERLSWLYRDRDLHEAALSAESVDDDAIATCIRREHERHGRMICPHTACAMEVLHRRREAGNDTPCLVAATAHPAKFDEVVEPILGCTVPVPEILAELLARPSQAEPLAANYAALKNLLLRERT